MIFGSTGLEETIDLDDSDTSGVMAIQGSFGDGSFGEEIELADSDGDGVLDIIASEESEDGATAVILTLADEDVVEEAGEVATGNGFTQASGVGGCSLNADDEFGFNIFYLFWISLFVLWRIRMNFMCRRAKVQTCKR